MKIIVAKLVRSKIIVAKLVRIFKAPASSGFEIR